MSRTFYIKNSQAPKVMSPSELLDIQEEEFTQYEKTPEDEDYQQMMHSPIHQYGYMLMGQEDISGRGFEVSYNEENQEYGVRVFTPSSEADWLGAFEFIKGIATYLQVQVVDEEENTYPPDQITYDYRGDITFGVKCYDGKEGHFLFGVNRPVCIDAEIAQKLVSAEDKVAYFSQFLEEQQYVDGYIAQQKFYQDNQGNIIGSYTLTMSVPTVLPYKFPPFIDITKISLQQEQVSQWILTLIAIEGDEDDPDSYKVLGQIDYKTFLERLPQHKISKLDGHYMLITLSDRNEMLQLLSEDTKKSNSFFSKVKNMFKNN